jgi:pimeloyl-ACP methyl ester carboxylesterase
MDAITEAVPKASFATMEGAGHWVHAEQPENFRNEVLKYLL